MAQELDAAATERLTEYVELLGKNLKDRRTRESFAIYAYGILGESERKSVEPIAALACADPEGTKKMHDKLLHFLGVADWDDAAVRLEAARYACRALAEREPTTTWVIDDTGFLKQGTHSVGVQRQYRTERMYEDLKGDSASITSKAGRSRDGTTMYRWFCAATHLSLRNGPALFPPSAAGESPAYPLGVAA